MKSRLSLLLLTIIALCSFSDKDHLEQNFLSPPESVKTSVYWYWMCGNISKEGVVKDLEEMKRVGINRVFIGHNYFDPYEGGRNVRLMSDEWWDVMHTALKKASELNIEVGIFNCPGWTQAGGPWIKPSQSMRYLTGSEIDVEGPAQITVQLAKPSEDFQDVKVIAYPFDKSEQMILNVSNAEIKIWPKIEQYEKMFDGDNISNIQLPQNMDYCIDIKADNIFTARSLTICPSHSEINAVFELQAKFKDEYRKVTDFIIDWHNLSNNVGFQPFAPVVITLDEIEAKEFRLLVKNKLDKGGIAEIELSSAPRIENYAAKTFAKMFQDPLPLWDYYMWREQPEVSEESLYVDPAKVLDISKYMSNDGTLTWDVPKGNWKILRMGMRSTQVTNNPAGPDGTGLEVDKMNKEHIQYHFNAYIGEILERIPKEDRKTFRVVIQDSYESGGQNFTEEFLQDFEKKNDIKTGIY